VPVAFVSTKPLEYISHISPAGKEATIEMPPQLRNSLATLFESSARPIASRREKLLK